MCCSWCQKVGSAKQFSLKTPNGNKAFCSEQCFTQSRRANFKRNKTCDWCRHVRHTVNYVDFQDGEHQLQFCSDKCLNQYKMNIFCTETQAHLDVHPHPQEASTSEEVEGPTEGTTTLITPDLWMRDCRSQSPETDKSGTPPRIPSPLVEIKMSPSRSRFQPQKNVFGEIGAKRKSKRSPKRSILLEQRRSSYSPPSPGGGSPPVNMNMNMNMRVPPTNFHPAMFPEAQRPVFFSPAILTSPPLQDARFAQRHLRKMMAPQMPPLLPLGPPRPPVFPAVFPSIVPPPVTFVPYPILLPIPIPIPIPIPLPGLKMSDLVAQLDAAKKKDESSKKPSKSDSSDTIKQENTNQSENQPSNSPSNQTGSQKHSNPPRKRKHITELQENDTVKKSKPVNS
uniref:Sine oculis-binding n=2 Tax=Lygus hesperus TaxID=30085 RepID=A0A146KXL0_LYGHE